MVDAIGLPFRFDLQAELFCVLGVETLPSFKLHGLGAGGGADGGAGEKVVQDVETDVPSGCTHRDETAIDAGPEREAGAAGEGFEFPAEVVAAPGVLEEFGGVGSGDGGFGNVRGRS